MKKRLALLLAAILLLTLGACGKKPEPSPISASPTDATKLAETFIEAYYLRDYATQFSLTLYDARGEWEAEALEAYGDEAAFCTAVQAQAEAKGLDVTIDSFDSYFAAYHQYILDDCREIYGEYTLTVKATDSVKMTEELLAQFRQNLLGGPNSEYMDAEVLDAITEVYTVTVNIVIDGEKKSYNENYLVYAAYYNGKWQVADHST